MIFQKKHIRMILDGVKTQTRRRHKYPRKAGRVYNVNRDWYHSTGDKILITKVRRQHLGDISPADAMAEGGYTIEQFKEVWLRINGVWNPDEEVTVYDFKVVETPKLNGFTGDRKQATS